MNNYKIRHVGWWNYEKLYSSSRETVYYCDLCEHRELALFLMEEHIEKKHLKELEEESE